MKIHSASTKIEHFCFLFRRKNELRHLCMDCATFHPKHVDTKYNWNDLWIHSQYLLLQCFDHWVKKHKSWKSISHMITHRQCIILTSNSHRWWLELLWSLQTCQPTSWHLFCPTDHADVHKTQRVSHPGSAILADLHCCDRCKTSTHQGSESHFIALDSSRCDVGPTQVNFGNKFVSGRSQKLDLGS